MNTERLRQSLIKHEGLKLKPYICTAGKLTIGVGRNLDDVGISESEAMVLLDNDIARCVESIGRSIPGWNTHDEVRQNVIVEMVFNLGLSGWLGFRNANAALAAYDYDRASKEMKDSRWYTQVGKRAVTLCEMMRSGEYP